MSDITVREYTNEYGLKDKWTYKGSTLIKTEMAYPKTKINKKPKIMSKKQELFEQIEGLYTVFQEEHNGTTKKSQANARKAIGELKKLVTDYRKESVAESK
jgi:hypothetical protein